MIKNKKPIDERMERKALLITIFVYVIFVGCALEIFVLLGEPNDGLYFLALAIAIITVIFLTFFKLILSSCASFCIDLRRTSIKSKIRKMNEQKEVILTEDLSIATANVHRVAASKRADKKSYEANDTLLAALDARIASCHEDDMVLARLLQKIYDR